MASQLAGAVTKQGPQPLGLSLKYDASFTDNVLKTSSDKESDTSSTVGLNFDSPWRYERDTWSINANYALGRTQFQDSRSQNRTSIVGNADFNWTPSPVFNLRVSDSEQNVLIDSFAPDVESNRTTLSRYTLAPSFNIRIDRLSQLVLSSQYELSDPHDADTDSERLTHSLQVGRSFDRLTSANFSASQSSVEYKYGLNGDSDSTSVNLSLSRRIASGSVSLGLGRTASKPENGSRSTGDNWSLSYNGQLSRQTVSFSVARSFSDSALSQLPSAISRVDDREVKKNTASSIGVSRSFGKIALNWQTSFNESESQLSGSERGLTSSLSASRSLLDLGWLRSPRLSASYTFTRKKSDTVLETDYQRNYSLQSSAQIFKDVRLNLNFTHQNRAGLDASTFEENKVSLGVSWSVL